MKSKEQVKRYLEKKKDPYVLKVGEMVIHMEYSNEKQSFHECIYRILKQKEK